MKGRGRKTWGDGDVQDTNSGCLCRGFATASLLSWALFSGSQVRVVCRQIRDYLRHWVTVHWSSSMCNGSIVWSSRYRRGQIKWVFCLLCSIGFETPFWNFHFVLILQSVQMSKGPCIQAGLNTPGLNKGNSVLICSPAFGATKAQFEIGGVVQHLLRNWFFFFF